jgi:hypothetical protein
MGIENTVVEVERIEALDPLSLISTERQIVGTRLATLGLFVAGAFGVIGVATAIINYWPQIAESVRSAVSP